MKLLFYSRSALARQRITLERRIKRIIRYSSDLGAARGMAQDITVLIANLGRPENLLLCLRSLANAAGATRYRVIVGFNFHGESDAPAALAREFPEVEQLRASSKLGYCRAYNQLMARSIGRYALLLDDDTILRGGTIDVMRRFMDAHPDVGIAGCRLVNPDGSYQKSTGLMAGFSVEVMSVFLPNAVWRDGVDDTVTNWRTVDWLGSTFLMVRAEVIEQVGMLDEFFYNSVLEADWCLQIAKAGWTVAYVPQAQIMHVGGPHSVQPGPKTYGNLLRNHINRYYFFRKHYGSATMHALRPIMSAGAALRVLNYGAMWLVRPDRKTEARSKIAAYLSVLALGFAARPDRLPDDLRSENEAFGAVFQSGLSG